jgi:hypothetical protein
MTDAPAAPSPVPAAGLCESCRHARRIASARSSFLRCARAGVDPRYAKYPRLPVLACPGHEAAAAGGAPLHGAGRG